MGQLSVDLSAKMEVLKTKDPKKTKTGIEFPRYFTTKLEAGKTPYDEIQWETRTASIGNDKGSVIFEQRDVECQWTGRRPPPTSSQASISTASWGLPTARPRWRNWYNVWSIRSRIGVRRTGISRLPRTARISVWNSPT
jgi:hypothetical protein